MNNVLSRPSVHPEIYQVHFSALRSSFFVPLAVGLLLIAAASAHAQNDDGQVAYSGKVMLKENGRLVPFPGGRVGTSDERGRMTESTAIEPDGSYVIRLKPNQRNFVQVLVRGYSFDPSRAQITPPRDREIPTFIATKLGNGTVVGTMKLHPASEESVSVANQRFLVKDAATGQLISTLVPDGRNKFRYSATEGTKVILEPKPNPGVSWTPSSQIVTLAHGTLNVEFQYLPSSAVGTANLDLAKERTKVPDVIEPQLAFRIRFIEDLAVGDELEIYVASIKGMPMTRDMRYTFLYRSDVDTSWRTAANNQRQSSAKFKVQNVGGLECKVVVSMNGAPMGSDTLRAFAKQDHTPAEPVRLRGEARMPGIGFIDPLTFAFTRIDLYADRPEGPVNQPRSLTASINEIDVGSRTPLPREGRRISFYVRHETTSNWTTVAANTRSMTWNWTPTSPGKWQLRLDLGMKDGEERGRDNVQGHETIARHIIDFVATTGNTSGITSQTQAQTSSAQPTPRPIFRPLPRPSSTPRPIFRPLPRPSSTPRPRSTPRPSFSPPPRAIPTPSPTPSRRPPGLFRRPPAGASS